MSIKIKFPQFSHHSDGTVWVHLDGVYWLDKSNERWFVSGVHPQGTNSLSSCKGEVASPFFFNQETEEAFPLFLAAIAAKKAELKAFSLQTEGMDKLEAIKLAKEQFDMSLKEAKELVEGCPRTRYSVTPLPVEVFRVEESNHPTAEEDQLCSVKGLWSGKMTLPASLLAQVEELIDWQEPLLSADFEPSLVQLLDTGECVGETEKLLLRFKVDTEEETTSLCSWKIREEGKDLAPDFSCLRVTTLDAAPALYSMYLAGKADEAERWKQRLALLIK